MGKSRFAATAEQWWKESPRAMDKGLLPTFPEVRNAETDAIMANRGRANLEQAGRAENFNSSGNGGYVFDFGEEESSLRPAKKPRAR